MQNAGVEGEAEKYALSVDWKGDDYGKRKKYYADAFLAGHASASQTVEELRGLLAECRDSVDYCDDEFPSVKASGLLSRIDVALRKGANNG